MTTPHTGSHVGRRLAELMHDARVAAAAKIIPAETEHRAAYHTAFMEQGESELGEHFRELFGDLLEDPDLPDQARAYLGKLCHPTQQFNFLLELAAFVGLGLAGPPAAAAGWIQRLQNLSLHTHGELHLSPAEAALAYVRGELGFDQAADEARFAGMSRDLFEGLTTITGEPPGPQELAQAYRRGFIDQDRYRHGIRQSRVKNEWIDTMVALRYAPPGAGEVIAATVEGHISHDEAKTRLSEAGIDPANFEWLYETAGRPPGAQEMIQLWRRNKVTKDQVVAAIRESNIKNKYIDAILETKRHVPPARSIVAMLRHGAIDDGVAREMLAVNGVEGADADAFIRDAHSTAHTAIRELSMAETVNLYNEGLIDHPRAHAMLLALRFNDEAAEQILGLADVRREHAVIRASVAKVRTAYTGHKIDRAQASMALDALQLDGPTRDHALTLWDLEESVNVRHLTEAQVIKAAKEGLIDKGGFVSRHQAMGYEDDDIELLWTLYGPAKE